MSRGLPSALRNRWEDLLDEWSNHIKDIDFDEVPGDCIEKVLKYARLTPSRKHPSYYEILRKLGKRILELPRTPASDDESPSSVLEEKFENLREELLDHYRNLPTSYRPYFGCTCETETCRGSGCPMNETKWNTKLLRKEISEMLGISLKNLQHETQLGFVLALVKSERYTPAEMHAIIKVRRYLCQ